MSDEDVWAFPTPIDKAERIEAAYDGLTLGLYKDFGPILVADDKETFDTVADEEGLSGSEYPSDRIDTSLSADEIRNTDTIVSELGIA